MTLSILPSTRAATRLCACAAVFLVVLLAGCGPTSPSSASPQGGAGTGQLGGGGTPTPPHGTTYVALGASDAFGVGTYDVNNDNWPTVLAGDLSGQRGQVHLINLGIPGATMAQAARAELPVALEAQPTIVTVWLAVNDLADGVSLDDYSRQLTALLTQLQRQTHARVYAGNLPDLTLLPYFANQDPTVLHARIRMWNAAIAAACATTGTHLVDLASYSAEVSQHPEDIARDGLHPSTFGALKIAQIFANAIQQTPSA